MFKSSAKPPDSSDDGTGTFPETGSLVVASRGSSSRLFDLRPHEVSPSTACLTALPRAAAWVVEQLFERLTVDSLAEDRGSFALPFAFKEGTIRSEDLSEALGSGVVFGDPSAVTVHVRLPDFSKRELSGVI